MWLPPKLNIRAWNEKSFHVIFTPLTQSQQMLALTKQSAAGILFPGVPLLLSWGEDESALREKKENKKEIHFVSVIDTKKDS